MRVNKVVISTCPSSFFSRISKTTFGAGRVWRRRLAELRCKGGVAGGVQLGEEGFDAGDGGGGERLVGVEQRGDELGRDGFHWLAFPTERESELSEINP